MLSKQNVDYVLGSWAASLQFSDIPDAAWDCLKSSLIDSFAVAIAGVAHMNFRLICNANNLINNKSQNGAYVFGQDRYYSTADAAFLNGAAIHSLDFDDTSFVGVLHPSTVVFPACLALAESMDLDISALLLAYITGLEAELYFADLYGDVAYDAGYWTTASLGVIGAAVACGKLLSHSPDQMTNSVRLALQLSMGMRSVHGSFAKAYLAGAAARAGLEAAVATESGINCGVNTLAGEYGYLYMLPGIQKATPNVLPGEKFKILDPGLSYKQYPLCSATQAAIDALLYLKQQHQFSYLDIHSINCYSTDLVLKSLKYALPENPAQAQFSMPFALATAAIKDMVNVSDLSNEWLNNNDMRSLASKVSLFKDDSLVLAKDLNLYPEASRVQVDLNNGKSFTHTILAAKGMPVNPFSQTDFKNKFINCTQHAFGDKSESIYSVLNDLRGEQKLSWLVDLLRSNYRHPKL